MTLSGAYDVRVSDAPASSPTDNPTEPVDDAATLTDSAVATVDLSGIESDLADVERALARLDNGTYWTCEVTGAEIPDEHLAANPVARRSPGLTA